MADYPARLVHTHRLFDGRTVVIRPIRHEDAALEGHFIDALSGESRYMRFQKCVAAASERLVHFLTDIDYDRHLALVCVAHEGNTERIVGEARYVVNPDGKTCEFAIVIADAWHKTGVAGLLMHELIAAAREHGLETMESPVLALNWDMLRFAHGFGFEVRHVPNELSVVQIAKRLQSDRTDAKAVPRLKEAKS